MRDLDAIASLAGDEEVPGLWISSPAARRAARLEVMLDLLEGYMDRLMRRYGSE